jgi:hypothetical protein
MEEVDLWWPAMEKGCRKEEHACQRTDSVAAREAHAQGKRRRVEARAAVYGDGKETVVLAGGFRGGMWWRTVVGHTETRPTGYIAQLER